MANLNWGALPARKRLLLFAGGPAGATTLWTLATSARLREFFDWLCWEDYHTTKTVDPKHPKGPEIRFYGAWETPEQIEWMQLAVRRKFYRLLANTSLGIKPEQLIKLHGDPTFSRQKCVDVVVDNKIQVILTACFGRLLPNAALELVGAILDGLGRVAKEGLAFNYHPGFDHLVEDLVGKLLPEESRGKDIIRALVSAETIEELMEVAWRVYLIGMTEVEDAAMIYGESRASHFTEWTPDQLGRTDSAINARVRLAIPQTCAVYPQILVDNLIRLSYTPEELLEYRVSGERAVRLGYNPEVLIKTGFKFNSDPWKVSSSGLWIPNSQHE